MSDRGTSFDPRIVLRPRTLDETLDLALAYLRDAFGDFAKLAALLTIVGGLACVGLYVALDLNKDWGPIAAVLVVAPILDRIVTVYGGRHLFQNDPRITQAIVAVLKRLPLAVVSAVLVTLPWTPMLLTGFEDTGWTGGGALVLTFWPFLLAPHAYLGEVAHLEQLSALKAAKRSRVLVAYRYGRALGLVLVTGAIRVFLALSIDLTTEFVLGFVLQFGEVADVIGPWAAVAGYLLAGPYVAMVRMFDYVDARTRREGWDIQVRFNAIAQRARDEEARRLAARVA
ncbi:hypothetical protein L6R52_26190 [Myxococcota bacterium]|nr:hypothetical protein [Myxococcota bacterium]